jgi:FixJ family two-component response regulator
MMLFSWPAAVLNHADTTMSYTTTPRALIADDQPEVLEALRLLLKGEGFVPHVVTSPAAVLQELATGHFDVLLMDLNYARDTTSGQEGLDLLSQIQAIDGTLPVIVMTGWGSVELAVEAMRRGVRDFVQKPWENTRLISILRTHVEQGQLVRKGKRLAAESKALGRELLGCEDAHVLLRIVAARLRSIFEARSVVVFTKAPMDQAFWATAQVGISEEILGRLKFEHDSPVITRLPQPGAPPASDLPEEDRSRLDRAGISVISPVRIKTELVAFIGLGPKVSGIEYDAEDVKFLADVGDETAAGLESLRLRGKEREYEEAREIQQGLLPKTVPQIDGHEISGAWQPASAVGGDYFDALRLSDSKVALCIADVVGKGMPAALLMSNLQAAVKAFATEWVAPRELCSKVNRVICSNIAANKFITFFYCLYHSKTGTLAYTNAGHNAPVLLRSDGTCRRLHEGGVVLGVFRDWTYEQKEAALGRGDRIVLFTDGATEVRNSDGEEFGEERLIGLLQRNRHLPASQLQETVMKAIAEFGGGEFQDDATLLILSNDGEPLRRENPKDFL